MNAAYNKYFTHARFYGTNAFEQLTELTESGLVGSLVRTTFHINCHLSLLLLG